MTQQTNTFAVTYKMIRTATTVSKMDYLVPLHQLKKTGTIMDQTWEVDSKGILHTHILWLCDKKNPYLKNYTFKGFTVKIDEIYDMEGWVRYMHKEDDSIANKFKKEYEQIKGYLKNNLLF